MNQLLHYRQFDIFWSIDAPSLRNIAIAADKYACTGALSSWAKDQLLNILKAPGRTDSVDGIAVFVAYIFDLHDVFWDITKRLIMSKSKFLKTSEFQYPTWGLDTVARQILPVGLLGKNTLTPLFSLTLSSDRSC